MARFVLLLHETPAGHTRGTHYDLMLEAEGVLQTWACEAMPAIGASISAEKLADHRLAYLDYEGEVSGGRGRVTRIDGGEYERLAAMAGETTVRVHGCRLRGILRLSPGPAGGQVAGDVQRWRVSLESEGSSG